jgi:rod shape determining protein RodA
VWLRLHIDLPLLLLLLVLTGLGMLVLYSASSQSLDTVYRQGRYLLLAYISMLVLAQLNPDQIRRMAPWAYLGGLVLLIAVELLGDHAKGAQRWLEIGSFRFQPSEIMKLVMPATVGWYLANKVLPPSLRDVLISLLIVAVPTALIGMQPDLGTAILVAAAGLFALFLAGIGWRYLFSAAALLLAAAWPAWHFMLHDYQRQRILTLLNPEADKLGAGWNIIQSKTAIGSGGLEGKGWLHGTQSHLDFLPESHTDFIIAVLAEEWGLKGVIALLFLYSLIIGRGVWIALNAQTCFGRLLAGSIVLTFFVYVFVNMGMVSGLLPVVGVPLPLVSRGGTALVTLLAGFGLLMGIATERRGLAR